MILTIALGIIAAYAIAWAVYGMFMLFLVLLAKD